MTPQRAARILTGIFTVSGVVHLVKPDVYEPLMPAWVPAHHEVIIGSGVAELACAAALAAPSTRSAAGWASAALLVAVFPGNVQMAVDALQGDNRVLQVATLARLPLQWPLIAMAVRAARGGA